MNLRAGVPIELRKPAADLHFDWRIGRFSVTLALGSGWWRTIASVAIRYASAASCVFEVADARPARSRNEIDFQTDVKERCRNFSRSPERMHTG